MEKAKRLLRLFLTFLKIGAFTFGGGYAMIALLEREIVAKKQWLTNDEFLDMTGIAEATPGPSHSKAQIRHRPSPWPSLLLISSYSLTSAAAASS